MAARGEATRQRILEAAERLVAERGIAALSLREAGASAGARNNSAAAYHFGTKDGVIDAIFELRMAAIDRRRRALLAEAEASGRTDDPRVLVDALVQPLVQAMDPTPGSTWYGRFLAAFLADPAAVARLADTDRDVMGGIRHVVVGLQAQLSALPPLVRRQRIDLAIRTTVYAVADYERTRDSGRAAADESPALLGAGLADAVAGLLAAPVSRATTERLPITT